MITASFPHLFSPLQIRGTTLKNRILSTGHDTVLPTDGLVNDALIAYQVARAKGGAGLIILQVSGVHETARYTSHSLMATEDSSIEGYRRLAEGCHAEGCAVFAQLFHPGREIMETSNGLLAVAYAPSASPNERFHVMPRPLTIKMTREIIRGYGDAAQRIYKAGLDGVEIVASHGYLPSQFLNPRINRRDDEYGGDDTRRLRFLREILEDVRKKTSEDFVIGLRISSSEKDAEGLTDEESLAACQVLDSQLDYVNVTAGTSATLGGAIHIAPPMAIKNAYLAPAANRFKAALSKPVFVAGRINQPQEAEQILAHGQADVCGMTRALICDPEMPNKAQQGKADDIRACIGCNQACIGRFHRGYSISCIQHPETGRELQYGQLARTEYPKRVMVIGGGPGGMKAAATAAQRGHDVTLYEAGAQLGGQARLAQLLPGRAEFGGIVTNLEREMELAGVRVQRNTQVDRALVEQEAPDCVILATGAVPHRPKIESHGDMQVVNPWQILRNEVQPGQSVLIADWRCDWIGSGIAILLARRGCHVRLAINGTHVAETLPFYVRDELVATLHQLSIPVTPYARLYGHDGDTVFMQHTTSGEHILFESVDTLVLSQGHESDDSLQSVLEGVEVELHLIGDCLAPRTAEEAIFEGMQVAWQI